MTNLHIADHLSLPPDEFVESKLGIIGKSGSGKSGAVKVILEELTYRERPFVCFDPVGVAWGLRSSLDGKSPGLPVLVIGGEHGDLKLERHAGEEIADAVMESNVSAIIDLSDEPKAVYREFARAFCDRLYSKNKTPRHVIIDEVPELAPQKLRLDLAPTFEAVERLVTRGRNKGIGVTVVSQRAATINKDLLTQVDALLVFALVSPQDRDALTEWVNDHDQKDKLEEFKEGLSQLKPRQAWWWYPAGGAFRRVTIREFRTLHPDRTHMRKMGLLKMRPVTTDVASVVASLGDRLQRLREAKKDVQEAPMLRSKVKSLEAEVARLKALPRSHAPDSPTPTEVHLTGRVNELLKVNNDLKVRLDQMRDRVGNVVMEMVEVARSWDSHFHIPPMAHSTRRVRQRIVYPVSTDVTGAAPPPVPVVVTEVGGGDETHLYSGAKRMLVELARRHPLTLTKAQLGTLSGFTPRGGTYRTYYGTLARRGFLSESGGSVRITQAGLDFVGEIPRAPQSHPEVMDMWRNNLYAGAFRMLDVVVAHHPMPVSKEDLGQESGFAPSGGTFRTYLGILSRNNLVRVEGDAVTADPILWPEELQAPPA